MPLYQPRNKFGFDKKYITVKFAIARHVALVLKPTVTLTGPLQLIANKHISPPERRQQAKFGALRKIRTPILCIVGAQSLHSLWRLSRKDRQSTLSKTDTLGIRPQLSILDRCPP